MSEKLPNMLESTIAKIREMVDSNTVVGEPIQTVDGVTIIPVSKISIGLGGGGSEPLRRRCGCRCEGDPRVLPGGKGRQCADPDHCRARQHHGGPNCGNGPGNPGPYLRTLREKEGIIGFHPGILSPGEKNERFFCQNGGCDIGCRFAVAGTGECAVRPSGGCIGARYGQTPF